jgi:hypothetical protein
MENEGAAKLAYNPMTFNRAKHIDSWHHYIGELVDAKTVAVISIRTSSMLDDGLTKLVSEPKQSIFLSNAWG